MKSLSITAVIKNGELLITDKPKLDRFIEEFRGDHKALIEIKVYEKGASVPSQVYFRKAILPEFERGFRRTGDLRTHQEIEDLLLSECPATSGKSLYQISQRELTELIQWSAIYGSVNLGLEIETDIIIDSDFIDDEIK